MGSWPNGIKLALERLLDSRLTQFVPGFDHQGEALGPPFLDARLHAMRSDGVDEQCSSRDPAAWRAEPSQGIQNADPFHPHMLEPG